MPHLDIPGSPVFVTWRLADSLPGTRVFLPEHLTSGQAFVAWDRLLDTARSGPFYLRHPEIARLVRDQIIRVAAEELCTISAFVIMPNHVHLLYTPQVSVADLMRRLKGPTACQANRILNRVGKRFWQEEYFDRLVRNDDEFRRIQRYIEWNPVKAALVNHPSEFPWSSGTEAPRGVNPALLSGLRGG